MKKIRVYKKRPTSIYGWDWSAIRRKALRRDKYRCFNCGITKKAVGRGNMHVHHIIPFRISHSNSLDNLITLCRTCHVQVEHHKIDLHGNTYTAIKQYHLNV